MQTLKNESLNTRKIQILEWFEGDPFVVELKWTQGFFWNSINERIQDDTLGIDVFDGRFACGLARVRRNRRDRSLDR
jgi:hypothetical protein